MPDPEPTPQPTPQPEPTPAPPKDDTSETEKWKAMARKHEAEAKKNADAAARLAEIEEATKSETDKAIAKARKEAAEAATAEVTTAYQREVASAKLEAAAGGKLADPTDAPRFIDLADLDLDDKGRPSAKSMSTAIEKLLEARPYLAAGTGTASTAGSGLGGLGQGARRGVDTKPSVAAGRDLYAQRHGKTNTT